MKWVLTGYYTTLQSVNRDVVSARCATIQGISTLRAILSCTVYMAVSSTAEKASLLTILHRIQTVSARRKAIHYLRHFFGAPCEVSSSRTNNTGMNTVKISDSMIVCFLSQLLEEIEGDVRERNATNTTRAPG